MPGLFFLGGRERDRFRTAALQLEFAGGKLKEAKAGLRIFTGFANRVVGGGPNGTFDEAQPFRLGAALSDIKTIELGIIRNVI